MQNTIIYRFDKYNKGMNGKLYLTVIFNDEILNNLDLKNAGFTHKYRSGYYPFSGYGHNPIDTIAPWLEKLFNTSFKVLRQD